MKLGYTQRGFSAGALILFLMLLGFVVFTALKVVPIYLEGFSVESAVASLEADKMKQYSGPLDVRNTLMKRLSVNNVETIEKDDISVVRDNYSYLLDVEYEVRIPYMFNVDLVFTFKYHAEVQAS